MDNTQSKRVCTGVSLLALITLVACSLFETGAPKKPSTGEQCLLPRSEDELLGTLSCAIEMSDANLFGDRLAQNYRFYPDPLVVLDRFPEPFTAIEEKAHLSAVFANSDAVNLRWLNEVYEPTFDGHVIEADYELTVTRSGGSHDVYRGHVQLEVAEGIRGGWGVVTWQDFRANGGISKSWTDLRYEVVGATGG
jgi:hypothetical protein